MCLFAWRFTFLLCWQTCDSHQEVNVVLGLAVPLWIVAQLYKIYVLQDNLRKGKKDLSGGFVCLSVPAFHLTE